MNNNIQLIEEFILNGNANKIVVNYINDELIEFYYGIAKFFCMKNEIELKYYDDNSVLHSNNDDLFQKQKILTIKSSNSKKIEMEIKKSEKCIIFTDYKNYKKYKSNILSVNGYDIIKDINFFLKNYLNLSNDDLINFCKQFPAYLFSEISKYEVNKNYAADKILDLKIDNILSIRKSIYNKKKTYKDLKALYENIKDEAKFKKFNFLTY